VARKFDQADELGRQTASALACAWRSLPPSISLSVSELAAIKPLLLNSGSAALAWWRIRHSSEMSNEMAELQQAYRLNTLMAAASRVEIEQTITFLRAAGVEPLMGKGWTIARLYPKTGLRPYGDVDLYVRPENYSSAAALLKHPDCPRCPVDLHRRAAELDDRSFDQLYARSQPVPLGSTEVRALGPEDNLRLICLHMLRHGAWRPLWLCDVAVALESRPTNFDWDYFLSGDKRRSDWVACAIGLAHRLLGARIDETPLARRAENLPDWLARCVLRQWGTVKTPHGWRQPIATYLWQPKGILQAIRFRWPNAIEATIGVRGPFNEMPRFPFQVGESLLRTTRFLMQLPELRRERLRNLNARDYQ
jgi:hypothetical protein